MVVGLTEASACFAFIGGIGGQEILLILAFALIIFGPKRIPSLARSLARITAQIRDANRQFQREIYSNLDADEILKENERRRRPARDLETEAPYPPEPADEAPAPVARGSEDAPGPTAATAPDPRETASGPETDGPSAGTGEARKDPGSAEAPGVEGESRREEQPPRDG